MPRRTRPYPYISMQELQENVASLPRGSESMSNPQASDTWHNLSHPGNSFLGVFPTVPELSHNVAPNDDQNYSAEEGQQHRSLPTRPFFPNTCWDSWNETQIQTSHGLQECQRSGPAGPSLSIQGAADITGHADESDATSSRQSSPFGLGNCYHGVAVNPPQPFHDASYNISRYPYQSTPGASSDTNRNIHRDTRYYMENSSTGSPSETPPPPLPAGADFNYNPDYPTTLSNRQPLHNRRRAQQRNKQDIKPSKRKRPSTSCEPCGVCFKRPGDYKRHLTTARAHNPAKGPSCPEKGCRYSTERFTRADNLQAHLVKIHKADELEAARYIQRWKREGRQ